ncbi:NAD(P)-binding protein [Martensiomyces pterosporus]|nr:NAD(P)-binding protein [Martensiomyces pterosporus]
MIGVPHYIQRFREKNDALGYSGRHVVVVGGTRGLGAATAEKLASLGASVTIVGRARDAGEEVIRSCQERSPHASSAVFKLVIGDLSLLSETGRIADCVEEDCLAADRGIDALVLAAGCYGSSSNYTMLSSSVKTSEGIDYWFALLYLSRFLLIQRLLPRLLLQPSSRVINILHAGSRANLDLTNLGLDGKSNLETISSIGLYLDAMTLSLAEMHHSIAFYHISTGPMVPYPVVEDNMRYPALAWLQKVLRPWLYAQSILAMEAAETVVYLAIQPEFAAEQSGTLMSDRLENLPLTRFMVSADTHDRIWSFTVNDINHRAPSQLAKCQHISAGEQMHLPSVDISH